MILTLHEDLQAEEKESRRHLVSTLDSFRESQAERRGSELHTCVEEPVFQYLT